METNAGKWVTEQPRCFTAGTVILHDSVVSSKDDSADSDFCVKPEACGADLLI